MLGLEIDRLLFCQLLYCSNGLKPIFLQSLLHLDGVWVCAGCHSEEVGQMYFVGCLIARPTVYVQ